MFNTDSNNQSQGGTEGGAAGAALCLLLFILLPLIWNPFGGASLSEIPKWIWLALMVTVGLAVIDPGSSVKKLGALPRPVKVLGLLWLAGGFISVLFSRAPITSWYGTYQGQSGFMTTLLVATVFVILHKMFRKLKNENLFLHGVETVGVICALYALWQFMHLDFSSPLSDGKVFAGRVYGFFSNPNDFGQYLIFPFFASATFLVKNIARKPARIKSQWKRKARILLHTGAMILTSIALFLTMNRASMLGVLVGGALFLLLAFRKELRAGIKNIQADTGKKLAVGIIAALTILAGVISLAWTAQNMEIRSLSSRQVLWGSALGLVPQTPVFGFGQAVFSEVIQGNLSPDIYEYEPLMALPNRVHNSAAELLLEKGIFGLAVVVLLLIVVMKQGISSFRPKKFWEKKREHFMAMYALSTLTAILVSLQFGYTQLTTTCFLMASLAILTAEWSQREYENVQKRAQNRYKKLFMKGIIAMSKKFFRKVSQSLAVSFAIIILALGFLWHGARMMQFEALLGEGMKASILHPQSAHYPFQKLLSEEPPFGYPYEVAFTMLESRFRNEPQLVQEFEPYVEKYGEVTGQGYQYHVFKGRFAYLKNDAKTARQEYAKALSMAPNSIRVIAGWALAAQSAGDTASFETLNKKFEDLLPSYVQESSMHTAGPEQETETLQIEENSLQKKREIFFKSNPVYFQMKEAAQE